MLSEDGDNTGVLAINEFLSDVYTYQDAQPNIAFVNPLGIDELPMLKALNDPSADTTVQDGPKQVKGVSFDLAGRWDTSPFWSREESLSPGPVPVENRRPFLRDQIEKASGLIRTDIGWRDFRLAMQAPAPNRLPPGMGKGPCRFCTPPRMSASSPPTGKHRHRNLSQGRCPQTNPRRKSRRHCVGCMREPLDRHIWADILTFREWLGMLKLGDLIQLAGIDLRDFKIHLATGDDPPPLEAFFDGRWKEWQELQTGPNFKCEQVLSLIHLDADRWLFAGVYEVDGVRTYHRKRDNRQFFKYSTTEISGLEHLVGRAIVTFRRDFRASYLKGPKYIDQLVIEELRTERMSVGDFPGYHSVLLSAMLLKTVVREGIQSWKAALSSVSGIYLVMDTLTGKPYVGSACGQNGIWGRWSSYADTDHGGNKELRDLLQKNGKAYADTFQFAILEVCDILASKDYVLEREAHWKNVLCSRQHGYNSN